MHFDADNLPLRRPVMVAAGRWPDTTISAALDAAVAARPDALAVVAHRHATGEERRFTYAELGAAVDRVAAGLARLGVGRTDVVAVQLPNWWEFTVAVLACARIGAVVNPLMHIFRERELRFMLGHGEATLAVIPASFNGHDFPAMYRSLQAEVPSLQHLVVVGGEGDTSFDALLDGGPITESPVAVDPDEVIQLIYTSGTTGEPKGVMHSSNTLFANIVPFMERVALTGDDVVLMASPMAHQTGYLYGLLGPVHLACPAVLLDVWDAAVAVALINRHRVTFTMASTPFLTDLSDATDGEAAVDSLRQFVCAGAPIPGPLVERAQRSLGAAVLSAWGMSENGAVTTTLPDDDQRRAAETDGCPLPGTEVKVVGEDGAVVPSGVPGRLLVRSCSNFGGYLKRPHLNGTDEDGWFDTGDIARLDDSGYIRITGRSKDVIIRGGENVPVVEVESLLYRHPAVAQVAIVAYPDERLGERACAVVVPKPDASFTFDDMIGFLTSEQLAKNYLPERLVVLDAMPTTPSGKIQKFKLRELIVNEVTL
ncbi:MAG: cyclohexanecarboxylate-CoA ligase [Actinomycetota bacterium]